ncbi:MAG: family 20 glycosylhydrolase, partial [Opitutaceae bacterium]|nr:family 20 glycosylhydrolase [Opitutaceae bacterium]
MEMRTDGLLVDDSVRILLPLNPSTDDVFLARELSAELSDRFGVALRTDRVARVPEFGKSIVLGTQLNPLVAQLASSRLTSGPLGAIRPEGYLLEVTKNVAWVAGCDRTGAFYGFQSLRQLIRRSEGGASILGVEIHDWPHKPFRGIKLYLPGRDNIPFFKRFVRNFMALYKYNKLILETNAAMRLNRHPELNAGWLDFSRNMIESRRDRPAGPHGEYMDSTHYDTGDGKILEQEEVADLVRWARQYRIDVIPEIPSLSHSYYLLTRHRELAEVPEAEWPDAYCPSNPGSYDLLFDVLDEYAEVIKPTLVHVGHDEWRIPSPTRCPRCAGRDARELFAADLGRIHAHMAKKNIGIAIWGDHLIEGVRGVEKSEPMQTRSGHVYRWPGALSPQQVSELIPKDIMIANWFWRPGKKGEGEPNEQQVENWGFRQFFGNFSPSITDWGRRSARPSVLGGAPSSWAATTEFNFGKDLMYEFLGCANLLWSSHWPTESALQSMVQAMMPDVLVTGRIKVYHFGRIKMYHDWGGRKRGFRGLRASVMVGEEGGA